MNKLHINPKILFIAILLIVFTVVGFNVFFSELRKRSKAAPTGTPELTLIPADAPPMKEDQTIKVAVNLNPNGAATELYSFDVKVKFDAVKTEFATPGGPDANVILASDILKQQVTLEGTDTIHIVGTKTSSPFTTANQKIADITFKMKSDNPFPVTFTWGSAILQVSNFVQVPLTLTSNSYNSSSSSTSTSSSIGNGAGLSFTSLKGDFTVGEEVKVDVMVTTSRQINSVGVIFSYNPTLLTYQSTTVNSSVFDQTAIAPPPTGSDISINVARKTATSGTIRIATVTFTAKTEGKADFGFSQAASSVYTAEATPQNILTMVNPYSVTVKPVATASSSSSSTSGGGGSSSSSTGTPPERVESNGDLLYVNSTTSDQAPLRYEQKVKLEKGTYILSASILTYTARGRGVLVAVMCGESNCGDGKKLNDVVLKTPLFPATTKFVRQEEVFNVTEQGNNKTYTIRVFVEDGSEADIDYISLTDVWGGERIENFHFEKTGTAVSPRKYPEFWDMDRTGELFSTVDFQKLESGALYINSSSRQ